ncbi:MAG: NIPSNAP family protein [Bacteroidia bacterium]|nr:NIPSNAP family protein [Bacteroidia bacterium]
MNKLITGIVLTLSPLFFLIEETNKINREYYQLTVYHFSDILQEKTIDQYLQNAYLPALHKKGISSIGVFKPIANDTAASKIIYVLVPFGSFEKARDLPVQLLKDKEYLDAGKEYLDATSKNPGYQRMENILMYAFELAPAMQLPKLSSSRNERVYELRNYESVTEKLNISKVKMFNEGGEIALFKRLNFNAIFYAEVIAGSHMPNLMYMTSFENMEQRESHWKAFFESDEWKKLKEMPEYQNNVSKAEVILTKAASYSDY